MPLYSLSLTTLTAHSAISAARPSLFTWAAPPRPFCRCSPRSWWGSASCLRTQRADSSAQGGLDRQQCACMLGTRRTGQARATRHPPPRVRGRARLGPALARSAATLAEFSPGMRMLGPDALTAWSTDSAFDSKSSTRPVNARRQPSGGRDRHRHRRSVSERWGTRGGMRSGTRQRNGMHWHRQQHRQRHR